MTIRVYLTVTYLGLVILMALGMWLTAQAVEHGNAG